MSHFFRFQRARASQSGTCVSRLGAKGPNTPEMHSSDFEGFEWMEKFGTIVISSSCAKKSISDGENDRDEDEAKSENVDVLV
jgi:hypothetical protein|mmetsp:Transcript_2195/g.6996  ORF Transcript_2195/g.6996 Transcript_2195/m.6996 type:complete len:82 (-) Transcript_2195:297-542(-)